MPATSGPYHVTRTPIDDLDGLRKKWEELETRADASFFLGWPWIGSWLATFAPAADVVEVRHEDRTVLLGVLVLARQRRHGVLTSRMLHLHRTGDPIADRVWIEHNGFLVDREHHRAATLAALEHLVKEHDDWDELVVGEMERENAELFAECGLARVDLSHSPSFGVDLAALRASGTSFLGSLSRNTRAQVRRSIRRFDDAGPLELRSATSVEEARVWLDELAAVHRARWGSEPAHGSGFAHPPFVAFHLRLLEAAGARDGVALSRVTAGDETIAWLYHFRRAGRVSFYLSAIPLPADPQLKPGLVAHALSIQHHLDAGAALYDFLGGDAQYKRSLGAPLPDQLTISLQRRRLKLGLERASRRLKGLLSGTRHERDLPSE